MIFLKLRKFIERNRESKNIFIIPLVWTKDLVYNLLTKKVSRAIFYGYKIFSLKNKYDIVFVIAKYKEDLGWLQNMSYKYILYDKYFENGIDHNSNNLLNHIKLPNIGREAHTYLTYIIDNYNSLPDFVGFLQGDPFIHSILLADKIYRFKGQGYYPLSYIMKYEDDLSEYLNLFETSTAKYFGIKRPVGGFPFGAQFIVSRDKIKKHSIEEYQFLLNKLIELDQKRSYCTKLPNHQKPCTCLNEISAWMLEVWWPILFDEDKNIIY